LSCRELCDIAKTLKAVPRSRASIAGLLEKDRIILGKRQLIHLFKFSDIVMRQRRIKPIPMMPGTENRFVTVGNPQVLERLDDAFDPIAHI
jgi:hypothetical protein